MQRRGNSLCRNESLVLEKERERKERISTISLERTTFFLFIPDCLRCQALEVGPRSGHGAIGVLFQDVSKIQS